MQRREIELTFADIETLERELEQNLRNGGAFVAGALGYAENQEVEATIVHPIGGRELRLAARVVWVGADDRPGVGLAFHDFDEHVRERLRRFVAGEERAVERADGEADSGPGADLDADSVPATDTDADGNRSLHERLRGLNTVEQRKIAAEGTPSERIALERMYGKNVWGVLLANQRITVPEVARIARMGALPQPLLEQIANNRTWLASAVVRRALLGNPRIGGENLDKVLRATPRNELKVMLKQPTFSRAIKERARKLIGV